MGYRELPLGYRELLETAGRATSEGRLTAPDDKTGRWEIGDGRVAAGGAEGKALPFLYLFRRRKTFCLDQA